MAAIATESPASRSRAKLSGRFSRSSLQDRLQRGLQAIARRKAEPARARVDARKDAVVPHVPRIADAGGRVRYRAGRDAARVEHPQRGDAGVVLADAGIVEKGGA